MNNELPTVNLEKALAEFEQEHANKPKRTIWLVMCEQVNICPVISFESKEKAEEYAGQFRLQNPEFTKDVWLVELECRN